MIKFHKKLLLAGALQTLAMAIYHFFIPSQFGWGQYLPEGLSTINWSLYGLNNYFSFNLLVVAAFLLYHLRFKSEKLYTIKVLGSIALLFWIFSAVYQLINPMPLPSNLVWLQVLLPSIAFLNIFLFIIPLMSSKTNQTQ